MFSKASTSSGGDSLSKESSRLDLRKSQVKSPNAELFRRESSMALSSTPASKTPPQGFAAGASLVGLLASKRLAKRLSNKIHNNRTGSVMSSRLSGMGIRREPTYRMEPYKKFDPQRVEAVIKGVVSDKLGGYKYNPKLCAVMSKVISEEIRDKVKALHFDRYKIISSVVIGEKKNQDIITCSRSVWDDKLDSYAVYNYQIDNIMCAVTVYGIYFE
ncbi:dynein light chain Tctex-type protein 2B-like [Mytilus trossulus]|uniref:dynein light chain Tctex-type protein 2B-like n=1 Tax=Mytilus trossulus TaxID=6551 RepID=UPI003004C511